MTQGNDDSQGLERKRKKYLDKVYVCLRESMMTKRKKAEAESPFNHTPSCTQKRKKMMHTENAPTRKG